MSKQAIENLFYVVATVIVWLVHLPLLICAYTWWIRELHQARLGLAKQRREIAEARLSAQETPQTLLRPSESRQEIVR